jgi:hypothetical protein
MSPANVMKWADENTSCSFWRSTRKVAGEAIGVGLVRLGKLRNLVVSDCSSCKADRTHALTSRDAHGMPEPPQPFVDAKSKSPRLHASIVKKSMKTEDRSSKLTKKPPFCMSKCQHVLFLVKIVEKNLTSSQSFPKNEPLVFRKFVNERSENVE